MALVLCWPRLMTFELKGWGFVCRQSHQRPRVRGICDKQQRSAGPQIHFFCTHRITKSEKVWRNYSNCGGICNYYKSSQPTKAALSTLHEVHWKLREQKSRIMHGAPFSSSTVCFLSFITKGRNYLGIFKSDCQEESHSTMCRCFGLSNIWLQMSRWML